MLDYEKLEVAEPASRLNMEASAMQSNPRQYALLEKHQDVVKTIMLESQDACQAHIPASLRNGVLGRSVLAIFAI